MDKQYFYCLKAFFAFLGLMYIPGLIYYPFFQDGFHNYFNYSGGLYGNFFVVFTFFSIATFLSFWFFSKIPYMKINYLNSKFIFYFISIMIVVFFILSIFFFYNYTSSFRHKNRLADAGGAVTLLFLLKPLIYFIVSLMLLHVLNGNGLGKKSRLLLILILVSTVLFLNSSLQFIIIPVILIILFAPKMLVINFYSINLKYLLLILISGPILCFVVVFIGVGNKLGYDFLLTKEGWVYLKGFGNVLFPRMSTSLFSTVIMFDNFYNGVTFSSEVYNGIASTLSNRLSLIFPSENFNSDLISTVNRLNYMEVFNHHADRAGASPGIISSVFFVPLFPYTFFIIPVYVALIFKSIRYHMKTSIRFNFLSMLILTYLILSLFEAPLNILYVVDPMFFLFFTVVFLGRFINVEEVFSK